MKSILLVGNYKKNNGGISLVIENIYKHFNNKEHSVNIYSLFDKKLYIRIIKYIFLYKEIKKYDFIHCHGCSGFGFLPIVVTNIIAKHLNKKIISTFHGTKDGLKKTLRLPFVKKISKYSNIWTTPSLFTTNYFLANGINCKLIPNSYNIYNFNKVVKNELSFVCLRGYYNFDLLVNCFKKIVLRYPKAKLDIYSVPKNLLKKQTGNNIKLFERISRKKLLKKLPQYKFAINTCNNDSFGYSIFESINSNQIVFSVNSQNLRTIFDGNIIYFSKKNTAKSLSKIIIDNIHNKNDFIIKNKNGIKKIKNYDKKIINKEWDKIYKQIY